VPTTRIDLIRHGQPEGGNRFRGHGVDDPLSPVGWQQMRTTAAAIPDWERVVSSPMRRCLAFAEWLSTERGLPISVEQDLREVGFGAWEGSDRDELRDRRREEFDAFYRDPVNNRPAGAEPLADFGRRVSQTLIGLSERYGGERVLVVAHAGVIRAAVGFILQSEPVYWYRTDVANAALTRIEFDRSTIRLVAHNWRPQTPD
jgi:broad specificity phosphatase PhoE